MKRNNEFVVPINDKEKAIIMATATYMGMLHSKKTDWYIPIDEVYQMIKKLDLKIDVSSAELLSTVGDFINTLSHVDTDNDNRDIVK